ncbi:uncharacterized protein MELLADRAFT_90947 [Melampsora larici-populina 98AG31]|uniref:Ribosomal protein L9 domain-containing protein n=1 Tax=Melampsora larici-populina (strain 98AG31 / pathotype 3-4-7) TaxID=747676 RepID=F4R851_MELLP|nr:uncharacterized protein MELLADRAFT_90947 [Melampsora larici-populina 98AG31]EGG11674.1 hypothetical protein MELLADRAFT_90947 [Melampsora larici-populina 98AG31]
MSKLRNLSLSPLRPSSRSSNSQIQSSSSSNQSSNFSSTSLHQVWVQKKLDVKLRVDHPELGKSGQVIRVKPGHMRQRLYPSGQALYCAKDGIPFHHLNPIHSIKSPPIAPSPGLSRPIIESIKRLGIKINLNKQEIKQTEELRELWIREHNLNSPELSNQIEPITNLNKSSLKTIVNPIPKGLKENLRSLMNSFDDLKPLIVFKRTGPNHSESLYASIKPEEIIEELSLKLNDRFDLSDLKEWIKIKEIYAIQKDGKERIKGKSNGIKSLGDHLIR